MQVFDTIKDYIEQLIVGLLAVLVTYLILLPWYDKKKIKNDIDSDFLQADNLLKTGQFKEAIVKYDKILELSHNKFPNEYASAQSNLGNAYCYLTDVKDAEVNAQHAINAYQTALEVYTLDKYPVEYARTQINIGAAYCPLARVRNTEVTAQNAISALQKVLEVYTLEKYPVHYAKTQSYLGNAYSRLAGVRDMEVNAQYAIDFYQKALEVYTIEKYPVDYAETQNDLEIAKGLLL